MRAHLAVTHNVYYIAGVAICLTLPIMYYGSFAQSEALKDILLEGLTAVNDTHPMAELTETHVEGMTAILLQTFEFVHIFIFAVK